MKHIFKKLAMACITLATITLPSLAQTNNSDKTLIQRGEYLAIAGDCAACHANPQTKNRFSGGFAIQTPMGPVFGANITPSKINGIGNYSLDDFSKAVRLGVAPNGKHLFPAMPYTAFAGLSDDDVDALYAYFMNGVAPDDNKVPETNLGFPFIRPAMIGWNMLFLDSKPVTGGQNDADPVQRGEYLVKTLAHCSTCHTPRNALAAEDMSKYLSGGSVGAWTAPNITPDAKTGIGQWSEADIVSYLKTGQYHGKAYANGDMGLAVQNSFSKLTDGDLNAIAVYLKQIPAIENNNQVRNFEKTPSQVNIAEIETGEPADFNSNFTLSNQSGAQIYNGACATCHGANGQGALSGSNAFQPLIGTSTVDAIDPANLIMTIREGVDRKTADHHAFMPAFKNQFNEDELQKVANYVSTQFGNNSHQVSKQDVSQAINGGPKPGFLLENAKPLSIAGIIIAILLGIFILKKIFKRKKITAA